MAEIHYFLCLRQTPHRNNASLLEHGLSTCEEHRLYLPRNHVGERPRFSRRRIVLRGLPHYRAGVCCLRCHLHSSPVQELTETIFGAALSRPQRPISSLCRSSFFGLLIASLQMILITLYFMALRFRGDINWIVAGASLLWLGILFLSVMGYYATRNWTG
jgi:hypothetical protein